MGGQRILVVPPPLRRGELGLVDLLRALLMLPAVSHVLPEADEGAELGDGDVAAAVSIQRLPYRLDALVGQPILAELQRRPDEGPELVPGDATGAVVVDVMEELVPNSR